MTEHNLEYFEYINKHYSTLTDTEKTEMLKNNNVYAEFLNSANPTTEEKETFIAKCLNILEIYDGDKFWLQEPLIVFEKIIKLISIEEISDEDIAYLVPTSKFAKGFRLYLIESFKKEKLKSKKKKNQRSFNELDSIIIRLLENSNFSNEINSMQK